MQQDAGDSRRSALKALIGGLALTSGGIQQASAAEGGIVGFLDSSMRASIEAVDSVLKPGQVKPGTRVAKKQIRGPLDPAFAKGLAEAIQKAAIEQQLFASEQELAVLERQYARKCVTFFPGAEQQLKETAGWQGGDVEWDALFSGAEILTNMALYSRLHTISARTPSPLSRVRFAQAVARNVMGGVVGENLDQFVTTTPRSDIRWLDGLRSLLASYQSVGYAIGTIGEGKYGQLDELEWREDGRASVQVFFYDFALIDAAQALAGEAQNDLAAALLPTQVIMALLRRSNIEVESEDFYIENTKNGFRPDGLVIQLNIQAS